MNSLEKMDWNWWDKLRVYLFSLISIPKPTALPVSFFLTEDQEKGNVYTWEKWMAESKAKYPIRYFLTETFPFFWRCNIWGDYAYLNRFLYWFRSNTYNRHHMLDLRQPEGTDDTYRSGWIDSDRQILFACFNILKSYVENEKPGDLRTAYSEEEIENDPSLKAMQEHYNETMTLYKYWTQDRKEEQKRLDDLLKEADRKRKKDRQGYQKLIDKYWEDTAKFEDDEDQALVRLMKIRKGMWT